MTIDYTKIAETVNRMHLPAGLGDKENACSIAALNIALTGELTDVAHPCMSPVIVNWVIKIQDAMPDKLRNSARWKAAIVRIPGTGREHEQERAALILEHMWTVALPMLQPLADAKGFGNEWRRMTIERTPDSARAADWAAGAAAAKAGWTAEEAAGAAASWASSAAKVEEAASADWDAGARAAAWAAGAAAAAGIPNVWTILDPCGLLERLVAVGHE
jgi:hypothetical protein